MLPQIDHIIVLMLENRSFDHLLGAVPGVDGVDTAHPFGNAPSPGAPLVFQQANAVRKMKPDPHNETDHVLRQILGAGMGPMGGFLYDFAFSYPNNAASWNQAMAYFPLGELPALHELAQAFTVCDSWFCSVPGPTWANRFFVHSGTSQGWVNMPDLPFHPNLHRYDQTTVYDRLNEKNISWRIYAGDISLALLLYNQRKPENLRGFRPLTRFFADVAAADESFPSYVFIEPAYLPFGQNDQHPPSDILKGDDLIASVYNAVRANDTLWKSTLLIVVWDEHGGFYDHAGPPAAVPPDHNVHEGFAFDLYGVRVPALLISQWTAAGVFRPAPGAGILDHTSILRYLTDKFGLGPLGHRTASAASFTDALVTTPNVKAPKQVGLAPRPLNMTAVGNDIEPQLTPNQAALIEFAKHLELESGAAPADVGMRSLRAMSSPQGEIEVARERVWSYINARAR